MEVNYRGNSITILHHGASMSSIFFEFFDSDPNWYTFIARIADWSVCKCSASAKTVFN